MSRPLRIEYPGATYHVMARGVAQLPIFLDDVDRHFLLRLVGEAIRKGRLRVDAFCLMLNHLHLLCETPRAGLWRIMQKLLSRYASFFNQRHSRSGHVFQGRYKALLVEDGTYFLNCSRYIHRNPEPLPGSLQEYRWSSYPAYIGLPSVVDWVNRERTLDFFFFPEDLQVFVESAADVVNPFEHAVAGSIFGGESFLRAVRDRVLATETGSEGDIQGLRALRIWDHRPNLEFVRQAVELLFRDWSACQRRRISACALRETTWLQNREVAQFLRLTPGAATHAFKAIRNRMTTDVNLRTRYHHLRHLLPKY